MSPGSKRRTSLILMFTVTVLGLIAGMIAVVESTWGAAALAFGATTLSSASFVAAL